MQGKCLSIIGVGLLGGSIGLAVRSALNHYTIIGYGHRRASLERAVESEAIDRAAGSWQEAVGEADLVILCTPVGVIEKNLEEMGRFLKKGAIVTDVGSTKQSIVSAAERRLPGHVTFVGSHPMAGSEKRGVEYARADLFQGATCILTPTEKTSKKALGEVEGFWSALGMKTTRLSPVEHDRLLADISHLPHAVAAALVAMQVEEGLSLAGKGFLDTTRVAGGDGGLWRDILLDNRENVRGSIRRLKQTLEELEGLLDPKRGAELAAWLDGAAARRQELLQKKLREMNPD